MVAGSDSEPTPLPDEESFDLSIELGPSDQALFRAEFVGRRDNPWLVGFWLVGMLSFTSVVWFLVLVLGSGGGDASEHFWAFFTLPLIAVAAMIVGVAIAIRFVRRMLAERLLNPAGASVQTSGQGLLLRVGATQRFVPWAEMTELMTTPLAVYVALADRTALMVPVSSFDDGEDRYVFASVIAKYARL
jgi:hypothetical protein